MSLGASTGLPWIRCQSVLRALSLWKSFGNGINSSAANPVCWWMCYTVVTNMKFLGSKQKVPLLFSGTAWTCPFFQEGGENSVQQSCRFKKKKKKKGSKQQDKMYGTLWISLKFLWYLKKHFDFYARTQAAIWCLRYISHSTLLLKNFVLKIKGLWCPT